MTEQNPNPVVVAVGTNGMDAALAYAAAEATRLGCGLHLLHVVHVLAQSPEMVLADVTDYERVGRQSLNAALQLARDLIGDDTTLTSELVSGGVVHASGRPGTRAWSYSSTATCRDCAGW